MYKLKNTESIIRLSDNASIPNDERNTDYQTYLAWVEEGNTPEPIDLETSEQIIARLESTVDKYLDEQAKLFRYDSIKTMVTYESDPYPKFKSEGIGAVAFRSAVYVFGVQLIGIYISSVIYIAIFFMV